MDIELLASFGAALGVVVRVVLVFRRKEVLKDAVYRIVAVGAAAAALCVGVAIAPSSWLVREWPTFAAGFYGQWLSNPTFLFIAGTTWALVGAVGMSEAWSARRDAPSER
jgi:hypothetical protein